MSWEYINLGDAATFVNGYAFKPSDWSKNGKEIIRIQNLTASSPKTNFFEGSINNKYKVEKGDLLISWSATLGVYEWEKDDAWLNQHIFKVVFDKKNFDKMFFKYLISSSLRKMEEQVHGATMKHITKKKFDVFQIPYPPLETQRKIAAILDAADAYKQKTKALIDKYDALTQSLFLEMFGDPVSNPKGWQKASLKKFGNIVTGNTPSRKNKSNYSSNYIEWIKTNNITSDIYITQAEEYLSEEGLKNARTVEKNSLLVACIAGSIQSIGRAALTDRRVSFNQQINAIEPNSEISAQFLYYLFKNTSSYIQDHASNGMKRMLSKGNFEKIEMIKPPFSLQSQFEEKVKAIEIQQKIAEKSLAKAEDLFNSLLQKAFKGELV